MKALPIVALFLSFPLTFFSDPAHAARRMIDAKKSRVGFEIVKYKIGATVEGNFDRFSGSVNIGKGSMMSGVTADIAVGSINTGKQKRDDHLRSADFFDVEKSENAVMKFRQGPGKVKIEDRFKLPGKLTLKGKTRDVSLDVKRVGPGRFKALTKINKDDFGVTWNRPLEKNLWKKFKGIVGKTVIGSEVDVRLDIVLEK
ncbi:MAG: YceI family protein [Bacteriovoracales bacterium]|nr:YceI family protein [Bacteriovoracales bacterium]